MSNYEVKPSSSHLLRAHHCFDDTWAPVCQLTSERCPNFALGRGYYNEFTGHTFSVIPRTNTTCDNCPSNPEHY